MPQLAKNKMQGEICLFSQRKRTFKKRKRDLNLF